MEEKTDSPLSGKKVALAETRQLDQLAGMLEKKGASVIRCPLVAIIDNPDAAAVETWIRTYIESGFDLLVLFTGEGLRRLLGFAERGGLKDQLMDRLAKSQKLTRGPKPARALKEIGLAPDVAAKEPTTDGILASLREMDLAGKSVGLQLYSPGQDRRVTQFLEAAGATVWEVAPYLYASKADGEQVKELILKMARGDVDVMAFTSASQADRLIEVAKESQLETELNAGLRGVKVAAVGPVVAARLQEFGVRVDVVPESSFFMAPLVSAIVSAIGGEA